MISLLLLAQAGCTTLIRFPPPVDSGHTGRADRADRFAPVRVQWVETTCDSLHHKWTWEVETDGWTRNVVLDVIDTAASEAPWEEQHILEVVDSHPGGNWDRLQLGPIPGGVDPLEWAPNENSVFDCVEDLPSLTFVVRVWNHFDDLSDCVVWGHDAPGVAARMAFDLEVAAYGACLILEP